MSNKLLVKASALGITSYLKLITYNFLLSLQR